MNDEQFIAIIRNPSTVTGDYISELKDMLEQYPFFTQASILYAKALLSSGNIHATNQIKSTALYCSDKRWLFYYLFPEKKISEENNGYRRVPKYSGNYFDLIESLEPDNARTSLKNLAERLKAARENVAEELTVRTKKDNDSPLVPSVKVEMSLPDYFQINSSNAEISEITAKKLIKDKKYSEAVEILKKLNLINPKKSIYFADQIRFLEKVIVNSKK